MERHDTHILSCSSLMENSYKFDKNGNLILESLSSVSFVQNKKNNKIRTSEIFKNIKTDNTNEEEYTYNNKDDVNKKNKINIKFNKDNNIYLSKNINDKNKNKIKEENTIKNNKDNNSNDNNERENFDNNDENSKTSNDNDIDKSRNKICNLNNNFQIVSSNQNIIRTRDLKCLQQN